jgi:hypothetical protein
MQYPGPDIFHPPGVPLRQRRRPALRHRPVLHHDPRPYLRTGCHSGGRLPKGRATLTVQVGERLGTEFPVQVPTHVSCIAQFEGRGEPECIQLPIAARNDGCRRCHRYRGTLIVPDPNMFTGEVKITRAVRTRSDRPGSGVGDRPAHRRSRSTGNGGAGHGAIDPLQHPAHRIR